MDNVKVEEIVRQEDGSTIVTMQDSKETTPIVLNTRKDKEEL